MGHLVRKRVRSHTTKDLSPLPLNVFFFPFNQETKWPCVIKLSVLTGREEEGSEINVSKKLCDRFVT